MLTTIYVRSLDGVEYRTSPDGVRWADQPRCQGEYLVNEEIKYFGLIGQGFWSLTGEGSSYYTRKAYPVAYQLRSKGLGFILTNLVVPVIKPGKSNERRAIERAAIIRYLEIWQDTVRGKLSRHNNRLMRGEYYYKKLGELYAEQDAVQRRLHIVRTKGLCH